MERYVESNFVRGSEGGSKKRRATAGKAPQEAPPSSASIFSELTGLPVGEATSTTTGAVGMNPRTSILDTNIGFKLLKKSGWKEGSGLGIAEQGRLIPLESNFKSDRRGIGAEKDRKQKSRGGAVQIEKPLRKATKAEKNLSKRARKIKAEEERVQEQAFEQQFYREFWPENI